MLFVTKCVGDLGYIVNASKQTFYDFYPEKTYLNKHYESASVSLGNSPVLMVLHGFKETTAAG